MMQPVQNKINTWVNRFSVNSHERCLMNKLENDMDELKSVRDAKKELLTFLKEQEEISRAEYEAQNESSILASQNIKSEVEGMKQTSRALQGYLKIMNTDEFPLTKLKKENDSYIKDTHARLAPIVKRARELKKRLDALKGTNEKCLELQKKTQMYMTKDD